MGIEFLGTYSGSSLAYSGPHEETETVISLSQGTC